MYDYQYYDDTPVESVFVNPYDRSHQQPDLLAGNLAGHLAGLYREPEPKKKTVILQIHLHLLKKNTWSKLEVLRNPNAICRNQECQNRTLIFLCLKCYDMCFSLTPWGPYLRLPRDSSLLVSSILTDSPMGSTTSSDPPRNKYFERRVLLLKTSYWPENVNCSFCTSYIELSLYASRFMLIDCNSLHIYDPI